MGYPGAGKTTTAEIIAKLTGARHLSSDHIRRELFPEVTDFTHFTQTQHDKLYAYIDAETERLLGGGKSVIYDANLNRYQHRVEKYAICERTHATALLCWIDTHPDTAKRRIKEGVGDPKRPNFGEIDEATFERLANVIENPHQDEPIVKIDGQTITSDIVRAALHL